MAAKRDGIRDPFMAEATTLLIAVTKLKDLYI